MSQEIAHQPQIKITWLIGILAAFAIFGIIGIYSKRMARDYTDYDQDRAQQRYATLAKVRQSEDALLYPAVDAKGNAHAVWVDQTKNIVRIPIEEAMVKAIDVLKAQPPSICAPTAEPMPGAAAPASASTNAAPATPTLPAVPAAENTPAPSAASPPAASDKPKPTNK